MTQREEGMTEETFLKVIEVGREDELRVLTR